MLPMKEFTTELDNIIQIYEKARMVQAHQWVTNDDLLCVLYLVKRLTQEVDERNRSAESPVGGQNP